MDKIKLADNILLLQGPVGSFFRKFRNLCLKNGAKKVYKINFSLGESFFHFIKDSYLYTKGINEWDKYLRAFIAQHQIQQIYLLSDARPLHATAIKIAKELKIPAYVFEQGYIRPNRITLEKYGVNGNTGLPKSPHEYYNYDSVNRKSPLVIKQKMAVTTFYYYSFFAFTAPVYMFLLLMTWFVNPKGRELIQFPVRNNNKLCALIFFLKCSIFSLWNSFKPLLYPLIKIRKFRNIAWTKENNKKYFILPLQLPCDSQIQRDSDFNDMYELIDKVLKSFSRHAPKEYKILIKHHPFDIFFNNYKKYIYNKCDELEILHNRVRYIHDISLPKAFGNSLATITVNSTTGLSAIFHNSPVKCLSKKAIYDMQGLTYQGDLDDFWAEAKSFKIDKKLFRKFYRYVDNKTQIVGGGFWNHFNLNRFEELFDIKR